MAKLSTLKPLVSMMKPLIQSTHAMRDTAANRNTASWRQWYKSARWQRLRLEVLARDLYTCQHTGVLLAGKAPAGDSPVVHHKVPHKGEGLLFWDIDNLEAVSKEWHDREGQREDWLHGLYG